jgi:hypothetical protein
MFAQCKQPNCLLAPMPQKSDNGGKRRIKQVNCNNITVMKEQQTSKSLVLDGTRKPKKIIARSQY